MFAHLRRSLGARALRSGVPLIFRRVVLGLRKVPLGAPLFAQRRMRDQRMLSQRTRKQKLCDKVAAVLAHRRRLLADVRAAAPVTTAPCR